MGAPQGARCGAPESVYEYESPVVSAWVLTHPEHTPWSYKGGDAEAWGSLVTPALRGTHLSLCWAPQ